METDACNYDSTATLNEPISCVYATGCEICSGETDGSGTVVGNDADDDGVCDADEVDGCTDSAACNFDSNATDDDSSCLYLDACGVCGGPGVDTDNDGVCDTEEIEGCMNATACNYDATANVDDGSCTYPAAGFDCAGNCLDLKPKKNRASKQKETKQM
jgi:hypothetical protein